MPAALIALNGLYAKSISRLRRSVPPMRSGPGALPQAIASRAFGALEKAPLAGLILLICLIAFTAIPGHFSALTVNYRPHVLAKRTLRVMSYNIHVGVGMDKKLDLARVADVIKNEHPDLVGLQEVDRGVRRTELKDEIVELSKLTGMEFAFAHNLDYQGGQYGVAILSRFPIQKIDHRKFENLREAERRGMIRIEFKLDNRVVNFVTTHLDYQNEDGRVFETEQLLKFLRDVKGPLLVVGDFNDDSSGGSYKLMLEGFNDAWAATKPGQTGFSYPADKPTKRIDYIFTRKSDRIKAKKAWIVNTLASDHLPVVADLELR